MPLSENGAQYRLVFQHAHAQVVGVFEGDLAGNLEIESPSVLIAWAATISERMVMSAWRPETSFMGFWFAGGQHHAQIKGKSRRTRLDHGAPRQGDALPFSPFQIANEIMLLAGDDDVRVGKIGAVKISQASRAGDWLRKLTTWQRLPWDAARLSRPNP